MIDNRNFAPPVLGAAWSFTGLLIALAILYGVLSSVSIYRLPDQPVEIEWNCMASHGPDWDSETTPGY
jgi:hypothetical protein